MQNHRFIVDAHHWFLGRERLFIDCQYIFHARDAGFIEIGCAPHFFPATVLDRGRLDETGAPAGVQQKLMRHAHVSTTMDQYGNASTIAKRKANRPIVQRLLRRPANQRVSIQ
jgi:integrase